MPNNRHRRRYSRNLTTADFILSIIGLIVVAFALAGVISLFVYAYGMLR